MRLYNNTPKLATQLSWLVAIILVLLPFHAIFTTWAGSNFGHLDLFKIWKEILVLLALPPLVWLVLKTPELKKWFLKSWVVRLYALYILLHLILGAWALAQHQVNRTALIYGLIINLRFIGFFIICALLAAASDFLRRNWRIILLVPAGLVIIFGLLQKFLLPYDFLRHLGYGPKTIPAYQTVDSNLDYRRLQSTLRGANPLGAYLVLIIPALWLSKAGPWEQAKRWLAVGAAVVVLFFTYSRSAEIGVAISLVLLAWWGIGKKAHLQGSALQGWKLTVFVFATLILVVVGLYTFRNNSTVQDTLFHTSSSSTSDVTSNEARLQAIKAGASDVVHEPLGRGVGTAGPASFRNKDHSARISENYFLQIGQEVGILGVIIFLAINFLVARELWAKRQDQLAKILLASLVGITAVNLISHAWTDDTLAYLWWGLAGIACAPAILESRNKQNENNRKTS